MIFTLSKHLLKLSIPFALPLLLINFDCFALVGAGPKHESQYNQQDMVVSGKVTNTNGEPLVGVVVRVKGTSNGVVTGKGGIFELSVDDNDTLVFSLIGYKTKEISIGDKTKIKVILEAGVTKLSEVVAIGYGSIKNSDLTNAVSKLDMEKVADRPITNAAQALEGQLSGVRVQEVSGKPGRALSIKIRGVGSITGGTEPLYVIDGVPVTGGLSDINTDNIESIEVLKDAASAAIYGSRGSNGVVLITTKKGKTGAPIVNFNSQIGIQQVAKTYDVLNKKQWIDFAIEERKNTWLLNGGDPNVPGDDRPGFMRIDPKWTSNPESFPNNNWQDLIYRDALFQNYSLSISGGSEATKYYFSGSYLNQNGVMINSNYKRYSFNANIESSFYDRLKFGLNINGNVSTSADPASEAIGGPIERSVYVPPIVTLTGSTYNTGFNPYIASFFINPLEWAKQVTDEKNNLRALVSLFGQVNIVDGLSFKSSISSDIIRSKENYYMTNSINRGRGSIGRFSTGESINLVNNNIFSYENQFGKNRINAIAGFTVQKILSQSTGSEATGFPNENVRTLNAATKILSSTSYSTGSRLLSYLARGIYNYDNKYIFTASIRRDGSSKFGRNNKWGWFPSLSGGWNIAEEGFMKVQNTISNLKLRASYGVTGNNSFSGGNFPAIGALGQANYVFGSGLGEKVIGLRQTTLNNPDLTWEKKHTIDLGLDVGVLNNRINLSLDVYRSMTKDLLLNVPIPQITGFSNAYQNVGKVENKGIELELNTHLLTKQFKWNINGNISYNKNTVKKLGPNNTPIPGIPYGGFQVSLTKVGYPIGAYYLIPVTGIFQTQKEVDNSPVSKVQHPGDLKYKDTNGDGIIDDDDRRIVGHNNPDFTWGMTNMFQYKNFNLSVFIDGEWGNDLINILLKETGQSRGNVLAFWLDRWKSPEDPGNGKVPRAAVTDNLTTASTFWMKNASFARIRNITLGYTFPAKITNKIKGISNARVYFSAENVISFDHYFGSPQTAAQSNNPLAPGIDAINTYPLARSFTLGLNLSFK